MSQLKLSAKLLEIIVLPLDKHAELRYNRCMARVVEWEDRALNAQRLGKKHMADIASRAAYAYMRSAIFWEKLL